MEHPHVVVRLEDQAEVKIRPHVDEMPDEDVSDDDGGDDDVDEADQDRLLQRKFELQLRAGFLDPGYRQETEPDHSVQVLDQVEVFGQDEAASSRWLTESHQFSFHC